MEDQKLFNRALHIFASTNPGPMSRYERHKAKMAAAFHKVIDPALKAAKAPAPAPRLSFTGTHTYAELEVSKAAYDEIYGKLDAAGYGHAFIKRFPNDVYPTIDMHGIGLVAKAS